MDIMNSHSYLFLLCESAGGKLMCPSSQHQKGNGADVCGMFVAWWVWLDWPASPRSRQTGTWEPH